MFFGRAAPENFLGVFLQIFGKSQKSAGDSSQPPPPFSADGLMVFGISADGFRVFGSPPTVFGDLGFPPTVFRRPERDGRTAGRPAGRPFPGRSES